MGTRKLRQDTQRAVTARFSMEMYLEIVQEAESRGVAVADVIRGAWTSHKEQKAISLLLFQFEKRMVRQTFEICSAVAGLSKQERKQAKEEFLKVIKVGG